MKPPEQRQSIYDPEEPSDDDDLWFMPGPLAEDTGLLPPLPRAGPSESDQIGDWVRAEAANAARLARVAARLGALDDRLLRGPEGWRHRLALVEASALSWFAGGRVTEDRLGLWIALRTGSVQEDPVALQRAGWAMRRLSGGPGLDGGVAAFLGRTSGTDDRFADWDNLISQAMTLHPITRAAFAFHLWHLASEGIGADPLEAAIIACRMALAEGQGGALFAPIAMGGTAGLRAQGAPETRIPIWLDAMERSLLTAMRLLDQIEEWQIRAETATTDLSGRTPGMLIETLRDWPYISAPMADSLTGASRAAVQRNFLELERRGLASEVTGHGRFRIWRASL